MSTDTFLAEVRRLEAAGSRLTGSESHRALVAHVAAQLAELGLEVQHDRHTFTRWDAPRARERLSLNVDGADVKISAAFHYSGTTGIAGMSGRLQLIRGLRKNWSTARALAVIEHTLELPELGTQLAEPAASSVTVVRLRQRHSVLIALQWMSGCALAGGRHGELR